MFEAQVASIVEAKGWYEFEVKKLREEMYGRGGRKRKGSVT